MMENAPEEPAIDRETLERSAEIVDKLFPEPEPGDDRMLFTHEIMPEPSLQERYEIVYSREAKLFSGRTIAHNTRNAQTRSADGRPGRPRASMAIGRIISARR